MRVERHWESAIVNVISHDFSRSPFIKSRCSHANSITDYNLIVLNKSILQRRKSVFHAPRNPSLNSSSNFAIFIYPVLQRLQASQLIVEVGKQGVTANEGTPK